MSQTRASFGSNTAYTKGRRRIRYWADKHDGRGYRRCSEIVKGTKRDADKVLALRQIEHGKDAPTPTLTQCYELYYKPWLELRYSNGSITRSTYLNGITRWNTQIEPALGSMRISDIRPSIVQKFILTVSPGVANQTIGVLHQIFDRALFNDVAVPNIKMKYELPKRVKTTAGKGSYTLDELRQIWGVLYNTDIEVPFLLQAFGSCRVGESLAVKVDEVEYDHDYHCVVIEIKRQMTQDKNNPISDRLKTPQSHRYIVLCGKVGERVHEIANLRKTAGFEWLCGQASPLPQRRYIYQFKKLLNDTGLPQYPPTTLRPSWQTVAKYTLKIEPAIIERLMGHIVPGVTGRHYDRPKKGHYINAVVEAYAAAQYDKDWGIGTNRDTK